MSLIIHPKNLDEIPSVITFVLLFTIHSESRYVLLLSFTTPDPSWSHSNGTESPAGDESG